MSKPKLGKKVSVEASILWRLVFFYFSVVRPASYALLLSKGRLSFGNSFKNKIAGKQGNLILNNQDSLKATIFQNLDTGVHSQNI